MIAGALQILWGWEGGKTEKQLMQNHKTAEFFFPRVFEKYGKAEVTMSSLQC